MQNKTDDLKITLRESLIGFLVLLLLAGFYYTQRQLIDPFEAKTLDFRFQTREFFRSKFPALDPLPDEKLRVKKEDVIIVGIDEKTKDLMKLRSTSRVDQAMVVDNLLKSGVKTVVVDVVFDKEVGGYEDREFKRILSKYGERVVLGAQWKAPEGMAKSRLLFPEPFLGAKTSIGFVNVAEDADSLIRTMPHHFYHKKQTEMGEVEEHWPSLSLAAMMQYQDLHAKDFEFSIKNSPSNQLVLGSTEIQVSGFFRNALNNYQGPINTFTCLSFYDMLWLSEIDRMISNWSIDLQDGQLMVNKKSRPAELEIKESPRGTGTLSGTISNYSSTTSTVTMYAYSYQNGVAARVVPKVDGSFAITGLPEGIYWLGLESTSDQQGILQRVTLFGTIAHVRDNKTTVGINLCLPVGGQDCQVSIEDQATGENLLTDDELVLEVDRVVYQAETDEQGWVEFSGIPSGPATFFADIMDEETYDSIPLQEKILFFVDGQVERKYNVSYHEENRMIVGTVFDSEGNPVSDALVMASMSIPSEESFFKRDSYFYEHTDAEGVFRLGRIMGGGLLSLSITVDEGDQCHNQIEPLGIWMPSENYTPEHLPDYLQMVDYHQTKTGLKAKLVTSKGLPAVGALATLSFQRADSVSRVKGKVVRQGKVHFSSLLSGHYLLSLERYVASIESGQGGQHFSRINLQENPKYEGSLKTVDLLNWKVGKNQLSGRIAGLSGSQNHPRDLLLIGPDGFRKTGQSKADGSFQFSGLHNGIYHLISELRDESGQSQAIGAGNVTAVKFNNSIAFVGVRARLEQDYYPTPFDSDIYNQYENTDQMYGVEIHAHSFFTLANNIGIKRVSPAINLLLFIFLSTLVLLWMQQHSFVRGMVRVSLVFLLYAIFAFYLFAWNRVWIDVWYPMIGLLAMYFFSVSYRYWQEQIRKRQIRGIFESMVPPSVVAECLKNDGVAQVNGKREYLSVLFSDIRGFTPMSEALEPEEVVDILNEYMGEMTKIIFNNNGTLDKFIGDAIMVIFGAPVPHKDHAYDAVKCACEMRAKLNELRSRWMAEGKRMINVGIGVNTGDMVVGNMGSKERMNYTVIGDAVNLSARLEANTNGGQILISGDTFQYVKDRVIFEKPDPIKVKGKSMLIPIYDIQGLKENRLGKLEEIPDTELKKAEAKPEIKPEIKPEAAKEQKTKKKK